MWRRRLGRKGIFGNNFILMSGMAVDLWDSCFELKRNFVLITLICWYIIPMYTHNTQLLTPMIRCCRFLSVFPIPHTPFLILLSTSPRLFVEYILNNNNSNEKLLPSSSRFALPWSIFTTIKLECACVYVCAKLYDYDSKKQKKVDFLHHLNVTW